MAKKSRSQLFTTTILIKTFPDNLFIELDRLREHNTNASIKRPQYYGKYIYTSHWNTNVLKCIRCKKHTKQLNKK